MKPTLAHLNPNVPRAADWKEVFPDLTIPIRSPIPELAELPIGARKVFQIDIKALDDATRERLVSWIAKKFGIPRTEVAHEIQTVGCPILTDDVSVSFDPRLVL